MNSKLWLTIKDSDTQKQYLLQRNKEITIMSIAALCTRIFNLVTLLISKGNNEYAGNKAEVITRVCSCLFHLLVIIVGLKFPLKVC